MSMASDYGPLEPVLSVARRTAAAEQLRAHLMLREGDGACAPPQAAAPVVPPGLVDIRTSARGVVLLPAPEWSAPELRFLVRPEVAVRLHQAAQSLPSDVRLGFWEGLRPLAVQERLWERGLAFLRGRYPAASTVDLERELEQYVARPGGPTPPHTTGCAVDIAAVDAFGQVLNPGEAWGRLGTEILMKALRNTGLVNYEPEWWHWSYGDHEWARANDCAPLVFSHTPEFDGPGGGI